jgi:hypothetical protein
MIAMTVLLVRTDRIGATTRFHPGIGRPGGHFCVDMAATWRVKVAEGESR